jgi:competence ComEA-like helix-hairpin-helix protein
MSRYSALFSLAFLAACGTPEAQNRVSLDWSAGEVFHVGARYRVSEAMTEEVPVALGAEASEANLGENWTDEVIWTYQVVETGFTPAENDDLYAYALEDGEVQSLAVVRAWIDDALNDDTELLAADPVIYLVFREDRDRLAAIVQFLNIDGERTEKAWRSEELGKSWSGLSQSMLTALPTYLAPFGTRFVDEERITENGASVSSELVDENTVDTFYDDEVGGGLVLSRYQRGQPWPTWSASESMESRLLTEEEVNARRGALPFFLPEVPENYDYLGALASSVDIDAALKLDAETMEGGFEASAPQGYAPWAGSWWPQSKGNLVFGYDSRDTLSRRIKADIDPLKREIDEIVEKYHALDEEASDYQTKANELATQYKAKKAELQTKLDNFYAKIRADIDGGKLKVKDGRLSHDDGWSYDLDSLSPFDKFALQVHRSGNGGSNPWQLQQWELLNHYSPGGGSWCGHCNGWAAAAILTNEPRESVASTIDGESVEYTTADIKGLLTEAHYSTYSRFYGERYDGKKNNVADLTPKAFHIIVSHYIRDRQVPLVFDTTATEEVWNFPAYATDLAVTEVTPAYSGTSQVNLNTATKAQLETLEGVSSTLASEILRFRKNNGAFQSVDELKNVKGMNTTLFESIRGLVAVQDSAATGQRSFEVTANVTFATDGVPETHLDSADAPEGFTKTWKYTLTTDAHGTVVDGKWEDDKEHPDFAWVPYDNPTRNYASSTSENPYLHYGELLQILGDSVRRR